MQWGRASVDVGPNSTAALKANVEVASMPSPALMRAHARATALDAGSYFVAAQRNTVRRRYNFIKSIRSLTLKTAMVTAIRPANATSQTGATSAPILDF